MMRGNKQTIGTLLIAGACTLLLCTPSASLATVDAETIGSVQQVMEASGGLTLGSIVLIAMAGAVVTFGKSRVGAGAESQHNEFNLGNRQAAVHGHLQGEQQ